MTNREKFEQEKAEFSKVIELFNKSGMTDFNEFLNKPACKYKPGDLVVIELCNYVKDTWLNHNVVLKILGVSKDSGSGKLEEENYDAKFLTPTESTKIGVVKQFPIYFLDKNSHLY